MSKLIMFFGFMWLVITIAGGIMSGSAVVASTQLTADLSSTGTTINVSSTTGYPDTGIIVVGAEHIAYSQKTSNTFSGTLARPVSRGTQGTTAVAHAVGSTVRTQENALVNDTVAYDVAVILDSAGAMAFVTLPTAVWDIIKEYTTSPMQFLGTDLQILTLIWGVFAVGLVVSIFITMAGGRRV